MSEPVPLCGCPVSPFSLSRRILAAASAPDTVSLAPSGPSARSSGPGPARRLPPDPPDQEKSSAKYVGSRKKKLNDYEMESSNL